MKHPSPRNFSRLSAILLAAINAPLFAVTSTLLDLNFNTAGSYAGWGSTGLIAPGNPANGVSSVPAILPASVGYNSGLFPTAPTSGYIALTPDASAVSLVPGNANYYFGGWAANVTLPAINSPYTLGGLGQTDPSKISFTARVRAVGMPSPNGAVVILRLAASGDNPGVPTSGYKRIQFEPVLLAGNDWTTIGGNLTTAGLTAAKGSTYAFPLTATLSPIAPFAPTYIPSQYTPSVEVSGFNRFGVAGYVAYNTPTGTSNGGRKNPGFGLTNGIRVEIDDVKLIVTDPATTGYIAATTPAQLLRNGDFNTGDSNWTFFEGAYVSTESWSEDASRFALIPGWGGTPNAGFLQNAISFNPANGDFFTATFRAKFEANFNATSTIVAFMDGGNVNTIQATDITADIGVNLGQWATYKATFRASPAQLTALGGLMAFKIQPLGRTVPGSEFSSVLIDNVVLSQATSASVGPQISVKVAGASRNDGDTATLNSPVTGKTTNFSLTLANQGAEDLTISAVNLAGTDFTLGAVTLPLTLVPGASQTISLTTAPAVIANLAGAITITSNDKDLADQSYVVNLAAKSVYLSDSFNTADSVANLGWFSYASTPHLAGQSTLAVNAGALELNVNSTGDDYPWTYIASKPFASPGTIDLASSTFNVALRAQGVYSGLTQNKVQVRLESLNAAGIVTGKLELGTAIDQTTAGALPGAPAYFTPDGINDSVAVLIPEGGGYTTVGGVMASTGVNTNFNVNAPQFRLVVQMTDFDFDLDAGNIVSVDSIALNLGTKGFSVSNGSFDADATDPASANPPSTWLQFPAEGVSKNVVSAGAAIYNATLAALDPGVTLTPYAGTKVLKVFGQNYYPGGIWQGPSQTGTVYQEFVTADNALLVSGAQLHARAAAKVFSIDPLGATATYNFGFKYLNAANVEIGRDVKTLTRANSTLDTWVALVANGTIPIGTARVQLISEFVQNASTDSGAVYLDDVSIGFGYVAPTVTVSGTEYPLVWSDEFDGTALSSTNWTAELGGGGWGNNEVQVYTASSDNLRVANGNLVINAIKSGSDWTSARIKSKAKREFRYGKIEFRAKLPSGVGPWPAAWMLGANIDTVPWPGCGEIDVMEWRGTAGYANQVSHATHSPSRFGGNPITVQTNVTNPSTTFNTYAVVWAPNSVTFSVNGITTGSWATADTGNPFENDFFLLLNMAIGGNYVNNQIDGALTSALYEVDYVRVYQAPAVAPLTAYQTYLQSLGLDTSTAFNVDANADGVVEGLSYSFGAASPRLGTSPATLVAAANSLTFSFDIRNDPALQVSPQISTDLVTWSTPGSFTLTDASGAASGYQRKVLAVTTTTTPRVFVRLRVSN